MAVPSLPTPEHLAVWLPNPLGDAVMATPALRALRRALPRTRITWVGRRVALEALEGLPDRDDAMPVVGTSKGSYREVWQTGRHLKRLAADAIVLMPNSWSSALAARLGGIRHRLGYQKGNRAWLLSRALEAPVDAEGAWVPRPMVDHYLELTRSFGAVDDGRAPALVATDLDHERAAARLVDVPTDMPLLAVNPGAGFGETKIYPPHLIARVIDRLRESKTFVPLIVCGPGEEALARQIAEAAGTTCLHTADAPPDLGELKGLLARARLLLTTDAGPRHLAEALDTPTVTWMGPSDPRWTAHSHHAVVRHEGLPCLACHLKRCPIEHPCMQQLDPERVVAQALDVWPS